LSLEIIERKTISVDANNGLADLCTLCGKGVYIMEKISIENLVFHQQ